MSKVYLYYEVNKVIEATKIIIENILHNIFLKYTWHAFIYITISKLITWGLERKIEKKSLSLMYNELVKEANNKSALD